MKEPKYGYHGNKIEPPIKEPIIEHFWIFSSFLNQIELFLCHWVHKLEDYKFLWALEVKEQQKNIERRWVIICFNIFKIITIDLSLVPTLVSSSILACFEWF
jgi:hypothetical protein